ncbi:MAG: hypothetical protein AVDCRST_MAG71-1235, partial [uncultured Lysobacter sp.]
EAFDCPDAARPVLDGHPERVQHDGRCRRRRSEGWREGRRQGPGLQGRQVL